MLNSGILALRRRSLWEAADMGLLLWRRNLGYLIVFFAIPFWVCAFALLLAGNAGLADLLPGGLRGNLSLLCAWLILWWFNPLFDRFVLHVVARRYFEPSVPFRHLFRGLGASLCRGLAGDLLWRRFSPWRAAVMPIRVLERGGPARDRKGKRVTARKRALVNGGLHFCIFLSAWCPLLQWMLVGGETLFIFFISGLFSDTFQTEGQTFGLFSGSGGLYLYTVWCVNYLVVESLYVCMGFGLYLNSRVEVEGWDIELLFRTFVTRYRKAAALVLLLFGLGLPRLTGVWGQSPAPGSLPPELGAAMPAEVLEEILDREIRGERKTWGIRFKVEEEEPEPGTVTGTYFSWVDVLKKYGAILLRGVLILALAALVLVCVIFVYRRRNRLFQPVEAPDIRGSRPVPAPAPEFLLEEAEGSYRRGLLREAWGLCYAAVLEALTRCYRLRFPPGATEYRCLALVRRHPAGRQTGLERSFADLIRHWTALAYGGIRPPGGAFEQTLAWARSLRGDANGGDANG